MAFKNVPVNTTFTFTTAKPSCGDGVCEPINGENCTTCFFDCFACSKPVCPGTPECSGHGDCVQGSCRCNSPWAGPSCGTEGTVVIIVDGKNSSSVIINPSETNVAFGLAVKRIQEIDAKGTVVDSYSLENTPTLLMKSNIRFGSALVEQFNFTIIVPTSRTPKPTLRLSLLSFKEATSYTFGNSKISVPANSVKYTMSIEMWSFRSTSSKLQIIMATNGTTATPDDCGEQTTQSVDGSNNVQWFTLNINGVTLYTTYIENGTTDGKPSKVSTELTQGNEVKFTVPFFWEQSVIDPVYTVLLEPRLLDPCNLKSKKGSGALIGGVVGGVVGTALIVGGGIYAVKTFQHGQIMKKLTSRSSDMSSNSEL